MCVPKNQIVRLRIRRQIASAGRRDVLKKFNSRPEFGPQTGNAQSRAEDLVQMLLFDAVILALARDAQTEQFAIERETFLRVRNDNRRVINAEKHRSAGL